MEITTVQYFSIAAKDRSGEMSQLTVTLREQGIDLQGLWGLGLSEGEAQFIIIPKDPDSFEKIAKDVGLNALRGTCFRLEGQDRVGALVEVLEKVSENGINLHAVNTMGMDDKVYGYIWAFEKDVAKIKELLKLS